MYKKKKSKVTGEEIDTIPDRFTVSAFLFAAISITHSSYSVCK